MDDKSKKKKPSGAEYEKRRRAAKAAALEAQADRAASGQLTVGLQRFARLRKPPARAEASLPWVMRLVCEALYQAANDAAIGEELRRSQIASLADRAAKLHGRAALEEQVKRLKAIMSQYQVYGGSITEVAGNTVKKPPTARGMSRPGPRPLPPEPRDPDEGMST